MAFWQRPVVGYSFCFLPDENEMTYQWAVSEYQKAVYGDQYIPTVIITDNDAGLRNALSRTTDIDISATIERLEGL